MEVGILVSSQNDYTTNQEYYKNIFMTLDYTRLKKINQELVILILLILTEKFYPLKLTMIL